MPANLNASSGPAWLDYLTVDAVKPWIGEKVGDDSINSPLQMVVSMACEWVQSFLGRPIAPTKFSYRFDGWGGWQGVFIELPYYPVLEVTSVVEYRGTAGPYTLTESVPDAQVDGWQCEYLTGRLIRIFPGMVQRPWFPGSRNILVEWTAGYQPIPHAIRMATMELVKHWWLNAYRSQAMSTGASPEYDPLEPPNAGLWAAIPNRVTALLEPYVQVGIG